MCIPGCDTRSLKGKVVSSHGLSKPHLEIIEAEDNGRASRTAEFRPNCLNGPTSLTSDKAWTSPNAALISLINWSGMFCQKLDPATVEYERQYQEKKVNSCRAHVQNGKCSSHNSHTASKQSNAHPSHQSRLDSIRISWIKPVAQSGDLRPTCDKCWPRCAAAAAACKYLWCSIGKTKASVKATAVKSEVYLTNELQNPHCFGFIQCRAAQIIITRWFLVAVTTKSSESKEFPTTVLLRHFAEEPLVGISRPTPRQAHGPRVLSQLSAPLVRWKAPVQKNKKELMFNWCSLIFHLWNCKILSCWSCS